MMEATAQLQLCILLCMIHREGVPYRDSQYVSSLKDCAKIENQN